MTTNSRLSFKMYAFLAASGLALVLVPSAGATNVTVAAVSTAPVSVDASVVNVPVLYLDMTSLGGNTNLGSFTLNMFGDVPSSQLSAKMYLDNGDNIFNPGVDTIIASNQFLPPGGGQPARAQLDATGQSLPSGSPVRYWFTVSFNGVPPGRKLSFGFQMGTDVTFSNSNDLQLPFISSSTLVRVQIFAKPINGVVNYATPTGGATRSGGLDTGLFVQAGQRVRSLTVPGNTWNVPSTTDADGMAPFNEAGSLGAFNRGALVGRVGSGPWQLLGQSSTITATSAGTLYVAPNDADYSDNFGSVRAYFDVLPSTTPKVWIGGTLGFETQADINQNWVNGRPYSGESVVFDNTAYDCDWNLQNVSLASVLISTAFTKTLRLVAPQYQNNQYLQVEGDAVVRGGVFSLGTSVGAQYNALTVKGKLIVRDFGTFDAGSAYVSIGVGAEVVAGGLLRSATGFLQINRAYPALPWYLRVNQATVAVTSQVIFNGIDYLDLNNATVLAFDNVTFNSFGASTSPFIRLSAAAPVKYVFNNSAAAASGRSPGVSASGLVTGSTVVFNNSTASGNTNFGSPNTFDPTNSVRWNPDGGAANGSISGTAFFGFTGTYLVVASTAPDGTYFTGQGGGNSVSTPVTGGFGNYTIANLRTPSTYFLFAYVDGGGGVPAANSARGGFGFPGSFRSRPFFLPPGAAAGGGNITISSWGAVGGSVTNGSLQNGPVIVETWKGLPNVVTSTRQARGVAGAAGYYFETPADVGSVLNSSSVFAFVDANLNGLWDFFEASSTVKPVSVPALSSTTVNLTISGGNAAPGGVVTLSTQAVHFGAVGSAGPQALIRARLTASASTASLAGVRLRYLGPMPSSAYLGVWADDGDGAFTSADQQLGSSGIFSNGPSTAAVFFTSAAVLQPGVPRDFFMTVDLNGVSVPMAGVMLDAATSFTLAAGTFSVVPGFPVAAGPLPVLTAVAASQFAAPELYGGAPTGFYAFNGQQLSITSTGTWRTGPSDAPTGPGGQAGTTGLNTVLPAANRSELIGRVRGFNGGSSQWFRVGTSTTIAAPGDGELTLAINDFVNAYYDNSGVVLASFSVSGSTLGALAGQVFYSTPVAGTLTVTAMRDGSNPTGSTSFGVASSSSYPYLITGLLPGDYNLSVTNSANSDFAASGQMVHVQAGATATLNATMYQFSGTVQGNVNYSGVVGQGNFHIGVATVTDFTGDAYFYGGATIAGPSIFSINNLPAPATYYLVAYRDGNNDDKPNGTEPLGYFGTAGGSLSTLQSFLTPIYVPNATPVSGLTVNLQDTGAIIGSAVLAGGATGQLVIETGRGVPGAPGYVKENRLLVPVPAAGAPPGGLQYSLGLLRPATGYSLFAFLDKNGDGQPSAGEEQAAVPANIAVPSGGSARVDVSLAALGAPPAPDIFVASAAISTVTFSWNLVPGATAYQLRRANNSIFLSLGVSASVYLDVLPDNTSSQIRSITASNGNGTSTTTTLSGPVFTLAKTPTTPVVSGLSAQAATVTWGGTNAPGTQYKVQRATVAAGTPSPVYLGTGTSFLDALAPASTYFWTVRAINGNGINSNFSGQGSTVSLPLAGAALSGVLSYAGAQTAGGRGFVIEASTSGSTFFPRVSSAALPGAPQQPWFLPVPPTNTYFVRAYVDVAGNGVLQPSADRGSAGGISVSVSSVGGVNFVVVADTVAAGAPAGVVALPGNGKVTVSWVAPTKNANNSNLVDLGGFIIERSTPTGSFNPITPTLLSSTAVSFIDNQPVPGVNLYRVRAVDLGGNQSAPSGVVSASPSSGGTIAGQIRTFSVAATGQYHVRLTTAPAAGATSVAEVVLTNYVFTGLADGVYYLRAYRDVNGNGVEDTLSEPGGTFGGLNKPFPITIVNANSVSGADATICDRSTLQPPSVSSTLLAGACPALDKGPGFVTSLFTLAVGGGATGSLGIGTQVNLAFSTSTAFETDLILLGPDGSVAGRDNRIGGANLTATLNTPGVYIAEPTSFLASSTGTFQLNVRLEGGFAGVIAGTVTYTGVRTGKVYTQLFVSASQSAIPILTSSTSLPIPTSFSFPGLPDGSYYLRAFRDANGNGVRDSDEPAGQYGVSTSSSLPIVVTGGFALGGPFTVTIADPAVGAIRGAALYDGTASGLLRVEANRQTCTAANGCNTTLIAFTTVAAGGVYVLPFLAPATDYFVRALVDTNGNGRQDALEPSVSSFPVTVVAAATATVSVIIRDAGQGQFGSAIVTGTVTYSGASTGPILIGLSHDPGFHSIDYLIVLPATGPFVRAGLNGDATYYMTGFIDTNLNNSPDYALGEPAASGSTVPFGYTPGLDNPPPIYVMNNAVTTVQLILSDPPNGSVFGTVRYTGAAPASANLIVQTYLGTGQESPAQITIPRAAGVSTYTFNVNFLKASSYYVSGFIDLNGNGIQDFGEPNGGRPAVQLSSGPGSFPLYGADFEVQDPGTSGASGTAGRVRGDVTYLGTQSGPLYVRFFNNASYLGTPLYIARVPATGLPSPGSGNFQFDRPNLPFGTYYLDAFRDPSDSGVYNKASHAHGLVNGGRSVTVAQERPDINVFGGQISDPGQGGSVNATIGSFASPSGVRFDGGATDLAAMIVIDSYTAPAPQVIVFGPTAQNDGLDVLAVRYSSTGAKLAEAIIERGDLQINGFTADDTGNVWIPGRIENQNSYTSTATLTEYNSSFGLADYAEYPDYQGFDGLSFSSVTGKLYAASRWRQQNSSGDEIRVLKINPLTTVVIGTSAYVPSGCQYCQTRVQGGALSPDGLTYVVYAITNQQNDGDRGLHLLLKFDVSGAGDMNPKVKDITALNGPGGNGGGGVSMVLDGLGNLYLAFPTDGNTARTYKFDVSGAVLTQTATASYGPINVHFSGGLGNMQLDPLSKQVFEVWESTANGGDYLLLRYDQSLNLTQQRTYDGFNNSLEDIGFSAAVYNSSTVFVAGAVNNGLNLDWGTVRFNGNTSGALSAAAPAVAITTVNANNYIDGTISYAGVLVTSGAIRTTLTPYYSDVPIRFATATFGSSAYFLFNNVPAGRYDVRSFIDPNGNFNAEEGEPTGATSLYGVQFGAAGTNLTLANPVQLCDRRQIAFGVDINHSFTAADCTSPDLVGAPHRLYTFRGTRGQPVTIALKAIGFYDSYLDLYGPDGDLLEYDDDSGANRDALISNYVLPADGVYTIDAQASGSGSFGAFRLALSASAGALGGISGSVNYAGSQGGAVIVGLFGSPSFSSSTARGRLVLTSTRTFSFDNLAVGTTYYLGAFIDVNANQVPDNGEDSGVFGSAGVPNPILLASGQIASGVEIAVFPSTASAASAAYLTGTASYAGTKTGALVLEFWSNTQFTGYPIASRLIQTGVGSYDVSVPGGLPYYVRAYLDVNGDFALQPDEPRGVFAPHAQGAEQVFAPVGQTLVGIDVVLKDPGLTAGGALAGEGTATLTPAFAVSGQTQTVVVTYTAGATGILAGGQVGFTVPPGFPFPNGVVATSTAAGPQAVVYNGPSAYASLSAPLALGQTLVFTWTNAPMPCALGPSTFTVSAVSTGTASVPLLLGSPAISLSTGAARFVQLDQPYFSVKQDELSDVRRLETRDSCGARAPVTAPLTVDLRAKRFNGVAFVSDLSVGVATSAVVLTTTAVSIDFDIGQSSKAFYVLAASTGFKNLEVHYNLQFNTTFYFGVSALPANALTAVSVSTASGGVAQSSATIGLGVNGQPNSVFLNFSLGDPQQPWHVLISSLPFKVGETPSAVWERWGFGQPNTNEIAWDGRFSPWISGGARVPNGLYYGRIEVGGGGVKDDTLRVQVSLPQFAGRAFDPGTVPNPPLSGVALRVYGPAGYFTTATDADGAYVLPGLGAGNYRLNVSRADYVDGSVDMTLNVAGVATSFIPRTAGVLVSSNATGGLDLFISRAPRLVVVPSLDPSVSSSAVVQWGSLQVRPSAASQQSTFYGPMRLNAGMTVFDDGGQWDPSTQQFIAKTLLAFNVPVGTYTVVADLNGFSRSSSTVYVGPDGARLDLAPFVPKGVISGEVRYAAGAGPNGLSVGITATALSTSVVTTGVSGGAFINPGSTYAFYSISGFDPGAYLLRANTQGLSAVTTGPIVVAGTSAVAGVSFPNFGAGASITGTITIGGGITDGTRLFVNAWSPGSFNFGSTTVYTTGGAAPYALNGLDAGATYQLYANIDAQGDYDVAGGFPRKVSPPIVDSFTLTPASGVIAGTILLRAGASDFLNVTLNGVTVASLHPDEIGHTFTQSAPGLPNFSCGGLPASNPSSSPVAGYCPNTMSSATFRVTGINTQTVDIRFLHSTTGQSSRQILSIVNGATSTLVADLSASTYSISGYLINQIGDALFNTNAKILANAPNVQPLGYPAGLSSTTARVTATRQDIDAYGVAISTVFNPISSRIGFLDASGAFTIPNCPNGVYVVRTSDLRACTTCAIIVPAVGRTVSVSGASLSSVTLTVSNGYTVGGTIRLDDGVLDAQVFDLTILNRRQEVVRSTVAYLGDVSLGQQAGAVDYSFTNLPAGEFYTLTVRGRLFPIKYAGRPIKFPDPALSPAGLQSNLVYQDVLLQRAAYIVGRLKDGGTGELVTASNAGLLAPNFAITATANPWTEGGFVAAASSVSARPIEADGFFRVGPLVPDVSYDLRLAQATWDPNFLASGSQNYAPVTIGGVKPTPGEIRDVGIVALGQGQSVTGVVRSTTTGLALGNIKVTARPSFGGDASLVVQTYTNLQGVYSLWVSSVVSNQFSLVAAPRGGNQASDGLYYGQVQLSNVNLQTQTSANFLLTPLSVIVTGQLVVADVATGGALSYPFGDKRGFPAGAINLQPVGVVPDNPLGDIDAVTDQSGAFSIPGLSTGIYTLHATSLGYAVANATVSVIGSSFAIYTGSSTPANPITLTRGATATGRILKSDGTSPNTSEVVGVAAANFGAGEFVVGSIETDAVAKTVSAYTISGFKVGVNYNIVLLSGSIGKEVAFPPEGAGVVFTAAESTTTKTINLTYRPAALDCLGTAKSLNAARSQFAVQIDCLKPLRQQTAADDDLTTMLTTSIGAGSLSGRAISTDRRRLTATYAVPVSETRFTMRIQAAASELDPRTGDSFTIDKTFDFYTGLDASADGRASNIDGGSVGMNPSAQDELLGYDERSRIDLPPGAFGEGADSLLDSLVVANPTTTVNVSMTKGRDQTLAKALSVAVLGYAPAALEVADVPGAFPAEMWAAMSKYRAQASTSTVGGANPLSAFYSIFLPAGIRHQLKQNADLTLSYNTATSTSTTDDKIQVWFYNATLGRFVLENTNRRLDNVNHTITVSVSHFSTFLVLDSTPVATSNVSFGGQDIAVANFPNPADCVVHSNIVRNSTLFGAGGVHAPFLGTMFRASIPSSGPGADLKYNIYSVNGEKVRTIEQGSVPAGQTYYTPWNCTNDAGGTVASGVYIGEVIHGARRKFFKIAIIKGSGL